MSGCCGTQRCRLGDVADVMDLVDGWSSAQAGAASPAQLAFVRQRAPREHRLVDSPLRLFCHRRQMRPALVLGRIRCFSSNVQRRRAPVETTSSRETFRRGIWSVTRLFSSSIKCGSRRSDPHGLRNSLFSGSEGGAESLAILASIVNTAKLHELSP